MWRSAFDLDRGMIFHVLTALDSIIGEADAVFGFLLRQMADPFHPDRQGKVPRRTPRTRAILISGASDGKSMLFSMRSICSTAKPNVQPIAQC